MAFDLTKLYIQVVKASFARKAAAGRVLAYFSDMLLSQPH